MGAVVARPSLPWRSRRCDVSPPPPCSLRSSSSASPPPRRAIGPPRRTWPPRQWFQDARFGLFIHWGVYAVAGDGRVGDAAEAHHDPGVRARLPARLQPREVRPRGLGRDGEGGGHEVHHDHLEAPRRLRDVGLEGERLRRRRPHALRKGRAEDAGRGVPEGGDQALLLPLAARLAPPRLLPARAHRALRRSRREGRVEPLPRLHGRAAQRAADRLRRRSAGSGSTAGGTSRRPTGASGQTYGLIHELQPAALVGSNHHRKPFPGEDFQMFEKDLPGPQHRRASTSKVEIGDAAVRDVRHDQQLLGLQQERRRATRARRRSCSCS